MSKHRPIFFTIALVVLFSAYVGYKLYENHTKLTAAATANRFDASERLGSMDRAFLQPPKSVSQLTRGIAERFPSFKLPVWTYSPEKLVGSRVDSVKTTALVTEVAEFQGTKLPEEKAYRLPPPEEKTLLAGDIISTQEVIYIIFTTPENTPEFPPPSFHELQSPSDVPIPYPLIAQAFDSPDDAALTELGEWIKSVGGAARAQSLIEAAGLSDSIRIETATVLRQ